MACHARTVFFVGLTFLTLACSPDDNSGQPSTDSGANLPPTSATDSGTVTTPSDAGGTQGTPVDGGGGAIKDSTVPPLDSDAATTDGGGAGADGGGATSLTGTFGSLGPVKPIVNSYWISTGLETLLYLSSTPLTCAQIMTEGGRWLLMLPSDGQVLEIVMRGAAKVGTLKVPPAEANYAQGGKSSATETNASSGTLTITKAEAMGVIEGSITATYGSGGSGSVMGTFHAEFCKGGQEW